MKRRAFLLAVCALPLTREASAQPRAPYRVGIILTTSPVAEMLGPDPIHPLMRAFIRELRRLGYSEDGNLVLERRSAEGKFDRFPAILAELLRLKPDVLVTVGGPMALAARKLTDSVPIVTLGVADPVAAGVVTSLARPGGNITGISPSTGSELAAKRLELLKAAVPGISRVAYLGIKQDWDSSYGKAARAAAQTLGLTLIFAEGQPKDYSAGFAVIKRERPSAVFVGGSFPDWVNRHAIVETLNGLRLPSTHANGEAVEIGGLMSYGARADDSWLRAAAYVDKILKGTKAGDLPIEQPTRFELVVNVKAAKALGIALPQSFLLRADRVIE